MILDRRRLLQSLAVASLAGPLGARGVLAAGRDTLRMGLSAFPAHFRPWINLGYAAHFVQALINRNLVSYDETGTLVGELAESWAQEGDTVWVFHLRTAQFSDGTPVTSADVAWTFERILAEGSGAYMRDQALQIARIEAVDERTFRVHTTEPLVGLPALMAYPYLGIVKAGSTDAVEQGVGAGPYVLDYAEKGVEIVLKASGHYFRDGLPHFQELHITPYADGNLRVAALQAGDVDLIDYVPWNAMDTVAATPGLRLDARDAGAFMYLSFNGSGPFADPKLRSAVSYAVRRDEIVNAVFFGHGAPLQGVPRSTTSPYYSTELANFWNYDPEKAKALLKEAGYENGLKVSLLSTSQYTMHRDTAVLVQSHLAEVGIEVELIMPDWATRVTMGTQGVGDFAVQGIGIDTLDPDAATTLIDPTLSPNLNRSRGFEVPGLSDLLAKGRAEFDPQARQAIYAEADRLACEHASFCGLCYRATGYAHSDKVTGLALLPDQLSTFSAVLFDRLALN